MDSSAQRAASAAPVAKTLALRPSHHRRVAFLRLTDQQMKVFGHDHISHDHKLIALPCLLEYLEKQIAPPRRAQQAPPTITTASDEMEISGGIVTFSGGRARRQDIRVSRSESVTDELWKNPTWQAVCLPHSIAQNAIEWGTRKLCGPPAEESKSAGRLPTPLNRTLRD